MVDSTAQGGEELEHLREENADLRTRLELRTRLRRWVAAILVVLTSLSVVAVTVAVWAHRTVFDTDQFMETVGPAIEDPAFYDAVSEYVSDQALLALDIEARVTDALTRLDEYLSEALLEAIDIGPAGLAILDRFDRPSLAGLAPPIADALETRITEVVDRFVTSDEFTSRFPMFVRRAHAGAVALVRGDLEELPNVYIESGAVRLDLMPVITDALRLVLAEIRDFLPDVTLPDILADRADEARAQLAEALGARLPDDFGQVTVMSEERLEEVQAGVRTLDRFVWLLVLLAIGLAIATIAVSPRRRRTSIQLALGVAIGLVIGAAALRRLESAVLDQISNPQGLEATRALLGELMASLRNLTLFVLVAAVVVAVGAYLAGRPAWLIRLSDRGRRLTEPTADGSELDRWIARRRDLLKVAGIVIAVGALFLVGIDLVSLVLVAAALGLYLWAISSRSAAASSEHQAQADEPVSAQGDPSP